MDFHKHLLFVSWKLTYKELASLRDGWLQSLMGEHFTSTHTHCKDLSEKLHRLYTAARAIFYFYCLWSSISLNEVYNSTWHGLASLYKISRKSLNSENSHRPTRAIFQEHAWLLHVFVILSQKSKITKSQRKAQDSINTFTPFLNITNLRICI